MAAAATALSAWPSRLLGLTPAVHSSERAFAIGQASSMSPGGNVRQMERESWELRIATAEDADEVARLLHDFNTEFATPSPGPGVLAERLRRLLASKATFAILTEPGEPAVGVALVTLRPNVWYDGPVALLDELYVVPALRGRGIGTGIVERLEAVVREGGGELIEINVDEGDVDAQRFYERHGFSMTEAGSTERAFYYSRELTS